MHPLPLRILSLLLLLIGAAVFFALLVPSTAVYMSPRIPIAITAIGIFLSGVGLFAKQKWGIYLFLFLFISACVVNLLFAGSAMVGNSWIGLILVGGIGLFYWKDLS
ncbi:MAG: hypothetical protein AB9M53_02705 [Leptothrix sp. (in: b-proteobacteria)]